MGNVFLGLKLQKNAETGDIAPVILQFETPAPMACVPLALTAIATADELPIIAWVVASGRAVPLSHFDVTPDWREFDVFNCAVNRNASATNRQNRNVADMCVEFWESQVKSNFND